MKTKILAAPLALALVAPAAPLLAQQTFSLPADCTGYMTVQTRACSISHHFTCSSDPEGWQRRIDLDPQGITYAGAVDSETQWVESFHVLSGHSETLAPDPNDPASFTELTETGRDSYDFRTISPEQGETRFVGRDELTGETRTINGLLLEETDYRIQAISPEGEILWESEGNEYINRENRLFLSGPGTTTVDGETFPSDDSPVEISFPGDPGFLAVEPLFGCNVVSSSWSPDE
ncbi:hypothetical protein [Pseudoroseicyclus tamaricis]|uniref:Uncharacterized protein n=1 Tax=Pseudoroseicyclus tamaricis TaxID=2705421 RepID=A0A6B2JMS5_9RHOB|nr:hypothetical protein [Pseudoroseicyclus tamaricis]NDV02901.1 hypothetical protein [Pseudoroseicyclus tamaricis]